MSFGAWAASRLTNINFQTLLKMKYLKSENIFDSFKIFYYLNKFSGYLFFTIRRDKIGNYFSITTVLDIVIFFTSFIFAILSYSAVVTTPFNTSSRSIILDIGVFVIPIILVLFLILIIPISFCHRSDQFQILKNYHFIDKKASNCNTYNNLITILITVKVNVLATKPQKGAPWLDKEYCRVPITVFCHSNNLCKNV